MSGLISLLFNTFLKRQIPWLVGMSQYILVMLKEATKAVVR